jgi:TrmH family RNA methyltransferase
MQFKQASNNQLKLWKKLQRTKYRKKEELFLAEGERCVEQIVTNGFVHIDSLIVEKGYQPGFEYDLPVFEVASGDFKNLSDTDTPQGVLAVCEIPKDSDVGQMSAHAGLLVALDAVQDPGNVGTIIRTASWFGAAGILFGDGTADPFHPKVVRSTAGATGALSYLKGDLNGLLDQFEKAGWKSYLMDGGDRSVDIKKVAAAEKSILVIGNEGNGISGNLFSSQRISVRIPGQSESVESLNAAIAMGIGMFHMAGNTNDRVD